MGPIWEENRGLVLPKNIDSGHSNFQLDARYSGCRRNLDYLQIHRTLSFLSYAVPSNRAAYAQGSSFDWFSATSTRPLLTGEQILMKNGSKKRRAWTSVQVRELKALARKKTPARKIAKTLKRTEGATRQKAFSIGLSLDSR